MEEGWKEHNEGSKRKIRRITKRMDTGKKYRKDTQSSEGAMEMKCKY